jgi:hypothetical protein
MTGRRTFQDDMAAFREARAEFAATFRRDVLDPFAEFIDRHFGLARFLVVGWSVFAVLFVVASWRYAR